MKVKSNNNIVHSCKYHVVWCSKYRRKVLIDEVEERFREVLKSISFEKKVDVLELEIMPDHIHLLIDLDPQYGVNRFIKNVKGATSRILRKEFKHLTTKLPTLWSNSYFVSTVGGAPLKTIKKYIENQKRSQRK